MYTQFLRRSTNQRALSIIMLLFLQSCANTISVHQIPPAPSSPVPVKAAGGFFYTLPKSVLKLTVQVKETTIEPSKAFLANDTACLNLLPYPIRYYRDKKTSYELTSLTPELVAVPDPTAFFFVETKQRNNPLLEKRFNFAFDADAGGALKTANFQSKDNLTDAVIILAKVATAIAFDAGSASNIASSTGSVAQRTPACRLLEVQTKRKALLDKLYEINTTIKPEVVNQQLAALQTEEAYLTNLLRGSVSETVTTYVIYKTLDTPNAEISLFNFSETSGFKPTVTNADDICLKTNTLPDFAPMKNAVDSQMNQITSSVKGIYYRLPAPVELVIYRKDGKKEYYRAYNVPIPQFGTLAHLPARIGVFSNDITYQLDPKTGALINFTANQNGEKTLPTDSIGQMASSLIDKAKNSQQKALDAEVSRLKSELDRAKLRRQLDSLNTKN